MPPKVENPVRSLYVHVPFCARKCSYCAFYSEASSGELVNRYTQALRQEMIRVAGDLTPSTVFFGGGTPSLLNLRQWQDILETMEQCGLLGAREWTVECNPATVSLDKARLLRSFGVNRMSMGVQSLDEGLLDRLGRIHTREMVFKSFDTLRKAGFDNINVDLMFAIPGQIRGMWAGTLREVLALESEHISTYEVIYEEDTALYRQLQAGQFEVDEALACDMYEDFVEMATCAGFQQYEVANFARPRPSAPLDRSGAAATYWCEHNVNYWRGGDFYGLGPSATSYIRGVRGKNWSNTQMYCELVEAGKTPVESSERLSPVARAGETAAFGLRMVEGWPFDEFRSVTGMDLRSGWSADIKSLVDRGWGILTPNDFRLSRTGLRFADSAAECFLR